MTENSKASFADFAKLWFTRIGPTIRPRTAERWSGILANHLVPYFKESLRAISFASLESYIAGRLDSGATPATVNREVSVLRHIFKRAIAWKFLGQNPIGEWRPLKEAPGHVRFLTGEEIDLLLAACDESRSHYLRAFVS